MEVGASPLFLFAGGKTVYRDISEEFRNLIEPVVEDHGFELVDVRLTRGRAPWLLRVTIDTPACDGHVPVDACAGVSRELGTSLDAADAIAVPYRLEVSSPGLDRVLSRPKDFDAACGCDVRIETRTPIAGRRRFRGRLLEFEGDEISLSVDGENVRIPFDEVAKANRIYEFTRDDFESRGRATKTARSTCTSV